MVEPLTVALAFYRVICSVMALHWEYKAGGDGFDPHLEAIRTALPLVSP